MEKTLELKCPNCNVTLMASLELEIFQDINITSTKINKEIIPYVKFLFCVFEKNFTNNELNNFNSKADIDSLIETVDEVLETLTPREEKIAKMRFGLGKVSLEHTLEQIGHHFALTGGRIWQIEKKIFGKLRHPSRSRRLKNFLKDI